MGYANIEFDTPAAVMNALKLTGTTLNGRKIMVTKKIITPKKKQDNFSWFMRSLR